MGTTIFRERADLRTRGVETLADQVMQDHQTAMFAWNIQETIAECNDQHEFLADMWQESLQCGIEGQIDNLDSRGQLLLNVFDRSVEAFVSVLRSLEEAEAAGHAIEGASQFRRGYAETRKIRHRINARWPMRDEETQADALQAFCEGRTTRVQDLIDELRGGSA